MSSVVLLLVTVGVTIYALVDCWRSTDEEVRGLPRAAWALAIAAFPLVGGTAYLVFGRDRGVLVIRRDPPRTLAPDDDPEFLRQLDVQRTKAAADERRRREQAERRERKERERQERQRRKEHPADTGESAETD